MEKKNIHGNGINKKMLIISGIAFLGIGIGAIRYFISRLSEDKNIDTTTGGILLFALFICLIFIGISLSKDKPHHGGSKEID